jgi:hypothetical protein
MSVELQSIVLAFIGAVLISLFGSTFIAWRRRNENLEDAIAKIEGEQP